MQLMEQKKNKQKKKAHQKTKQNKKYSQAPSQREINLMDNTM